MAGLLSVGCAATPGADLQLPQEAQSRVEQILEPWVSDTAPGVAVAMSWNDEVVFAQGAGLANLEHNLPITPDSVFQVASVSKQFTAFATLLLVSEGEIDLDADIRSYLPDMPETGTVITVRHLLDHTSGLREINTLMAMAGWMPDDVHTKAQLNELMTRQSGVNFEAGWETEYSNTGYALLAEIVSRVSGQSFPLFMQTRVFGPLNMTSTRFLEDRGALIPARAASYYPHSEGFNNVLAANESAGATGLYTSVLDLLKWAENFETQRVGNPTVFALMEERAQAADGRDSVAAKGQEFRFFNGLETWSHGGTGAGYRSFLIRIPEEDFELAVISNRTDFDKASVALSLIDAVFASDPEYKTDAQEVWEEATPEQLSAYAGDYELFPGVVFSLRAEQGGLTFSMYGAPRAGLPPLPQIGTREFLLNDQPERTLIFDAPVDGVSAGLDYRIGLDGALTAPRIELAPFAADTVDLAEFMGRCQSAELATYYDLRLEDGELRAKHPRLPEFALSPYQNDVFIGQGPLQKLDFQRDVDGHITGFFASASLAEGIWFACADK